MSTPPERLRRWRLILGDPPPGEATGASLHGTDLTADRALAALYDAERRGGLGSSSPTIARWLGDIRTCFPAPVVSLLQRDALDRLNLKQLLLEPELLEAVEPDVRLVAELLALSAVMPARTRDSARRVVGRVVEALIRRLEAPTREAVTGSLQRASRNLRPRPHEIDWSKTIRANLRHYQPQLRTIIPERRIGSGRRRNALRDVMLCVDQSGSMATSVVYAGVCGSVLASIPAVRTRLAVFDTAVVDLSAHLADPVELLFGTRLGGGTDIRRVLAWCEGVIDRPAETIVVLVSDLFEGGDAREMRKRAAALVASGVRLIVLLALSDDGAPAWDHRNAAALAALGVPAFACTPDLFPSLMAAALADQDLARWAASHGIVTARPER